MSFLKSGCTMATSAPYSIPTTARTTTTVPTVPWNATAGKNGTANRRKP